MRICVSKYIYHDIVDFLSLQRHSYVLYSYYVIIINKNDYLLSDYCELTHGLGKM